MQYLLLMRLHRPVGIWLLLWPTLWAIWIAGQGQPKAGVFTVFVLGTIVLRSAGCVFNDFADRKIDPYVERTAGRPIASGKVTPAEALMLFVGLMFIGLGLVMTMNTTTIVLSLIGAAFTVIYPFMKRVIAAPQLVLGLAFAWGVPMAYTATTDSVPLLETARSTPTPPSRAARSRRWTSVCAPMSRPRVGWLARMRRGERSSTRARISF
jgi:4-hydroxybenzoate polyprenyltransferase